MPRGSAKSSVLDGSAPFRNLKPRKPNAKRPAVIRDFTFSRSTVRIIRDIKSHTARRWTEPLRDCTSRIARTNLRNRPRTMISTWTESQMTKLDSTIDTSVKRRFIVMSALALARAQKGAIGVALSCLAATVALTLSGSGNSTVDSPTGHASVDDSGGNVTWIRDLEYAKELAKSENKPMFILFTGHGWCYPCALLDRQVLRAGAFVDSAAKKYVFVEVDANFGDDAEQEARKTQHMSLRRRFMVPSVPTVVLIDEVGRPYSYLSGYEKDSGPQSYLRRVAQAESARDRRDELLLAAASETGITRVRLLNDALDSISPLLGGVEERGGEPLLRYYREEIQEILALTSGLGSIANKYHVLKERRDKWLSSESVFTKLETFKTTKDYSGAIDYIEVCLEATTDDSVRWRLESIRQIHLERSHRYDEALINCKRLLGGNEIPDERREWLLDRECVNLFRLDRIEEGIALYDRRIDAADEENRKALLESKAQMVLGREPVSRSISAWDSYRAVLKLGSDDWLTATALLSRELRRAERHQEALRLIDEYLEQSWDCWLLLDAAEIHIALGDFGEAQRLISFAASANQKPAVSASGLSHGDFKDVDKRVKALQQDVEKESLATNAR